MFQRNIWLSSSGLKNRSSKKPTILRWQVMTQLAAGFLLDTFSCGRGGYSDQRGMKWQKGGEEELRDLYSSPSIVRILKKSRRVRHVARMREERNACRLLVGKPEGKRPLGRPRCSWVDNINMDLSEMGWDGMDWIGLAQDRTSGELLWMQLWIFGFHKVLGNYQVAT
jgi:hypothetical protein